MPSVARAQRGVQGVASRHRLRFAIRISSAILGERGARVEEEGGARERERERGRERERETIGNGIPLRP